MGGIVYLVGAGPGDIGLLTLRAAEVLRRADVVIYDGLVNPELLHLAPSTAEIIFAGKHDRSRCVSQEEINALLLAKARERKCVVRLKGGDPYLFGRGGEEAEILADQGIAFEVIPGVSSIQAVPGYAGIPLSHRNHNSSLTIVTGHQPPNSSDNKLDWAQLANTSGTLVVLMGLRNLRAIAAALIAHGRDRETAVAVISQGCTSRQRSVVGTLASIADQLERAQLPAPAVIVIGDVVRLREKLNWFERRPLFGKRVVVTQRHDLGGPLSALLRDKGAEVLDIPATRWSPHPNQEELDKVLQSLSSYHWILFSNPHAVDFFLKRLLKVHKDLRALGTIRLGAYGPRTGEALRAWHLEPAAVALDHKTPLIIDAITSATSIQGQRFLVLRGELAMEKVPEALTRLGASAEVLPCYAVEPETSDALTAERLLSKGADWIVFASALAIEHFHRRFDLPQLLQRFPKMRVALASETIQWALEELGLEAAVVSKPNDIQHLTEALSATAETS